jgi:uncharacterized protein YggT (Ycf19 family)
MKLSQTPNQRCSPILRLLPRIAIPPFSPIRPLHLLRLLFVDLTRLLLLHCIDQFYFRQVCKLNEGQHALVRLQAKTARF